MRLDTPVIPAAPALPEGGLRLGPPPTHLARLNACPHGRIGTTMAVTPTRVESAVITVATATIADPVSLTTQSTREPLTERHVTDVHSNARATPICCRETPARTRTVQSVLHEFRSEFMVRPPESNYSTANLQARAREINNDRLGMIQREEAGLGHTFYTRDIRGRIQLHLPVSEVLRRIANPESTLEEEIAAYKEAFNVLFEYCITEGDSERTRVARDIRAHITTVIQQSHQNMQNRITRVMLETAIACMGSENAALRSLVEQSNRMRAIQVITGIITSAVMAGCFMGVGIIIGRVIR